MTWQLFIALRHLASRRKERFISIISLISILGVAVGVAALIIVISVMTGFDEDLKDKIIGTYSHIEILSDYGITQSAELAAVIAGTKHVEASSFFLNGQAMIRKDDNVLGIVLKGIVPETEVKVKRIAQYMKEGSLDLGGDSIVIGSELASKLGARLGDTVALVSPTAPRDAREALAMATTFRARGKDFKVSGIFTSGMYEYDMNLAYIDIEKAQELLGVKGLASGAAVRVDDLMNVTDARRALQQRLGPPYIVRTWIDSNKNFIEAIKLEKTVMFIILTLIVTVACFNIASALIMTVLEKAREIGMLKAIGASSSDIMLIFALEGGSIGVIGTALGASIGALACWCLKTYKFINLPRDIYYIDKLPVKMDLRDMTLIVISSIIISLIATLYPAYKASKLDPVEALRYE